MRFFTNGHILDNKAQDVHRNRLKGAGSHTTAFSLTEIAPDGVGARKNLGAIRLNRHFASISLNGASDHVSKSKGFGADLLHDLSETQARISVIQTWKPHKPSSHWQDPFQVKFRFHCTSLRNAKMQDQSQTSAQGAQVPRAGMEVIAHEFFKYIEAVLAFHYPTPIILINIAVGDHSPSQWKIATNARTDTKMFRVLSNQRQTHIGSVVIRPLLVYNFFKFNSIFFGERDCQTKSIVYKKIFDLLTAFPRSQINVKSD